MSQQILDTFLQQVRAANHGFTEKRSSLRDLIAALRNQIKAGNCVPFATIGDAKALCKNSGDARLGKYATALTNLVNTWGKQTVVTPRQIELAPPPITLPRVTTPPRVVSNSMNADPKSLLASKRSDLDELAKFASMDASNFGGSEAAIRKEKELLKDEARCRAYQSASQSAGGKQKLPQSTLKAVYDLTIEARGAVCTTFALAAAHILTDGRRQQGKVRIEVLGCARGRATHMYVVAGRHEASTLGDPGSWGDHAYIVDPWGTATYGNSLILKVSDVMSAREGFSRMYFAKIGQFYDNATPDPTAEDNKAQVDVVSIERRLAENKSRQLATTKKEEDSELAQVLARRRGQFS